MTKCKYPGQFGKLVIGEEEVAREATLSEGAKDVYGKLVTDGHAAEGQALPAPDPDVEAPAEAVVEEPAHDSLSVRKVKEELKGDVAPSTIDRLMRDEFMRPDGARKSVLNLLKSKEAGRDNPRAEVIGALEAKLAEE